MITYKEWKSLNESFGGAIPIGVGTPSVVGGIMGSKLGLDEAKKGKKKMFGDEEVPEEKEEEEEEKDEKHKDDDDKEEKEEKGEKKDKDDDDEKCDEKDDKRPAFLMSKKKSKKMTKENEEWYNSVKGQLGSDPNQKSWDGFSTLEEDAVIPPADPNAELVDNQPGPGEVGYSPSTRLGGWFTNY
jgi:hypothetical protein